MNSNHSSEPLADLLVVDDVPDNVRLLATMLGEQGYKVRKVTSGPLALRVVSLAPPDLILLDINMPQINGYEICKKLKADPKTSEIPVIFISALDDVWDKVKAFDVGGVDYITKPFQGEEVLARVKNQLTLRSLSKQLSQQNAILAQEIRDRQQVEEALRESEARERERAQELEVTLAQLKRTQSHLIQSEKMSSLGQMVAGIAHEINNPVSFIYGNLALARQYVQDLLRLVESYQQISPDPPPEIQHLVSEIDLEFLREDWQKLMGSMEVGTNRIHEIVRSLQIFSRVNQSDTKPVDIHEGLNHTLLLLQHRLRAEGNRPEITVIKDYGQLPPVTCCASQLNQVFMNLLNNAIDALESKPVPRVITIRTELGSESGLGTSTPSALDDTASCFADTPDAPDVANAPLALTLIPTLAPTPNAILRRTLTRKALSSELEEPLKTKSSKLIPQNSRSIIIRIADNGHGMSEAVLHKIFDPFFTTKPVGSGTGLGLSISYQIVVEKHKGQLSCVSALGKGTELIVEIPLTLTA